MIICEIGQNHCGNIELAKQLIDLARENGADLVKFQLYNTEALYPSNSPVKARAKEAELSYMQAKELFDYGRETGIEVFFSVFDAERVEWCEDFGVKRYKIACTFRDTETLEAVEETGKPIILSSKQRTISSLNIEANLYCIPEYPAHIEDIDWWELGSCDGFSDHTVGLDAAKNAIYNGAKVIEKHFALDHKTGVDAPWSMNPEELRELVEYAGVNNTS